MKRLLELETQVKSELLAETICTWGEARFRVTGASMLPSVRPGDILMVRRQGRENLSPGTIIVCLRERRLQAHRIVSRCGDRLVTRGDALAQNDFPVSASEILGCVAGISRKGVSIPLRWPLSARALSHIRYRSARSARILLRLVGFAIRLSAQGAAWVR